MKRFSTFLAVGLLFLTQAASAAVNPPVAPEPASERDQEPVVIAQRLGSTDYVVAAWMKWTPLNPNIPSLPSVPQIRASSMYASNLGVLTNQTLTWNCGSITPTSGDPFLAENPTTGGLAPKRVYLAGATYCTENGDTFFYSPATATRITVWSSDNAGQTWTQFPGLSEYTRSASTKDAYWFADKPSIAVSTESTTLGHVYVAHMAFQQCWNGSSWFDCGTKIYVYRWNDPSGTFVKRGEIANPGTAAHSPIILTDNVANRVSVIWIDRGTRKIKAATSTNGGATFTNSENEVDTGVLYSGIDQTISRGGVAFEAQSFIMARFNAILLPRRIGVLWHARDSLGTADIKFVNYLPATRTFGTRRTVTQPYGSSTPDGSMPGDQWNAAIDHDANGNFLVTHYDMPLSETQFRYSVKGAMIDSSGARLNVPLIDVSPVYNGYLYPPRENAPGTNTPKYQRSLGEYQDVWNWFGNWYSVYIGANSTADTYVVKITP